jgi:hypothetical protein
VAKRALELARIAGGRCLALRCGCFDGAALGVAERPFDFLGIARQRIFAQGLSFASCSTLSAPARRAGSVISSGLF